MAEKLPYVPNYGVVTKALEKIKSAATPERFTQDFLSTKLGMKGGSNRAVIPFLKRVGFIGTDGSPTEIYKRFRNAANSGAAAAQALKAGFKPLYDRNEYAHDLNDKDLKGLIVEATGSEPDAGAVKATVGSFKALKAFAKFDGEAEIEEQGTPEDEEDGPEDLKGGPGTLKLGLSYTINLNLPATSDIAVFNAIFKSLREHLLR
jgi:Family of unknown function (DUF5343)